MEGYTYEIHNHIDIERPVTFDIHSLEKRQISYPNWHENIEILCIVSGEAEITLDSLVFRASKDDIIVINSDSFHTIHPVKDSVSYYCLIIDKDYCKIMGFDILNNHINEKIQDNTILSIFYDIDKERQNKEAYYESAVKYLVCSILVKLYRSYCAFGNNINKKSGKSETVKNICKYINANYTNSIRIEDIAQEVSMSKYYLCRIFKETMGVTITEYINFKRCKKAKRLLIGNNMSVSSIAELCGFENMSYFSKIYKKYMNVLPSQQKKAEEIWANR